MTSVWSQMRSRAGGWPERSSVHLHDFIHLCSKHLACISYRQGTHLLLPSISSIRILFPWWQEMRNVMCNFPQTHTETLDFIWVIRICWQSGDHESNSNSMPPLGWPLIHSEARNIMRPGRLRKSSQTLSQSQRIFVLSHQSPIMEPRPNHFNV